MHEAVTLVEVAMKYEMDVGVHQRKCQDSDVEQLMQCAYPVHPIPEIPIVVKHSVHARPDEAGISDKRLMSGRGLEHRSRRR